MKNHYISVLLALTASCQKIDLNDLQGIPQQDTAATTAPPHTDFPDTISIRQEYLLATNDTARFYLSGREYTDIQLSTTPSPTDTLNGTFYRLPTRHEVTTLLRYATYPTGYWQSGQRILCHDPTTGQYYTYLPQGTVTQAGKKTPYCILPIRSTSINSQDFSFTYH